MVNTRELKIILVLFLALALFGGVSGAQTTDTVGGTAGGSTTVGTHNYYLPITASSSGTLQTVGANFGSGGGSVTVAIYTAIGGLPGALLGNSITIPANSGWQDIPIPQTVSIVVGTDYYLAFHVDSAAIYYQVTGGQRCQDNSALGTWPSVASATCDNIYQYNLRMTYEAVAPPATELITFSTNPLTYPTTGTVSTTVTATCNALDTCAVQYPLGTTLATGTGTATLNVNTMAYGAGSYNFYANDITLTKNSIANTLMINTGHAIDAISTCGNQALPATCVTTGTITSYANQLTGALFLGGNVIGSSNTAVSDTENTFGYYAYVFNSVANGNYPANTASANVYLYIPFVVQNATATFSLVPPSNTFSPAYYPWEFSAVPYNGMTFSLTNSINGGANIPIFTGVPSISYIPPSTQVSGNYVYTLTETLLGNSLTMSAIFTPLSMNDIGCPLTFNGPLVQYLPSEAFLNKACFNARPTSWKLSSSPVIYTHSNVSNTIWFTSNRTSITTNIMLTYPFIAFNITLRNNPLVQNTINFDGMQVFTTNSASTVPTNGEVQRKLVVINTFNERTYLGLKTTSSIYATALVNNFTFPLSGSNTSIGATIALYTSNNLFQNPPITISNITTVSSNSAGGFLNAINNFCPSSVAYGTPVTYSPYLVEIANGTGYTFNLETTGGYVPQGYYMVTQEFNGAGYVQVGSIRTTGTAFSYPLLSTNVQYRFLIYAPNCNSVVYTSPSGVWVNPITLVIAQGGSAKQIQTISANFTCAENFTTNSISCSGVDTRNFVNAWNVSLYNVTGIYSVTNLVESANFTGSSFSWTSNVPLIIPDQYQVVGTAYAPGGQAENFYWYSLSTYAFISPFAEGGALISLLVWFIMIGIGMQAGQGNPGERFNWDIVIALANAALLVMVIFGVLPIPGILVYVVILISTVMIVLFEVPKVSS